MAISTVTMSTVARMFPGAFFLLPLLVLSHFALTMLKSHKSDLLSQDSQDDE